MHLSNLKLWNFRKFGSSGRIEPSKPNLNVPFQKGVNILIGENDSGKTAIIDAIKLVLKTHSAEWIRVDLDDFYEDVDELRIECLFEDLNEDEAKNFTEWLSWSGSGENAKPLLQLILRISRKGNRVLPFEVKAGPDTEGYPLTAEAREFLKATYLRPLRDANSELIPKRNSRLSQILAGHDAFKGRDNDHSFVDLIKRLNHEIGEYFNGKDPNGITLSDLKGKELKDSIDKLLGLFSNRKSKLSMSGSKLQSILEALCLLFDDCKNLGLGSHNLLFIAAELLHLQNSNHVLRLGLVEEIEAHLHPQVQMQVIETLQKEASSVQLIFTTHSPNIGSKIPLQNLIICQSGQAYPMGPSKTKLEETDYKFLQRFLDVTKANLFFSRGVILVEGWAEELLIPALAKKININLTEKGVSVINIGNTAFLRYAKVFQRQDEPEMKIPVAVITDVDVVPFEKIPTKEIEGPGGVKTNVPLSQLEINDLISQNTLSKESKYNGQVVKSYISPFWTLEYCISLSVKLRKIFFKSVLEALKDQKIDEGVVRLTAYDNAIQSLETHFNNWADSKEVIAYKIYDQILTGANDLGVAKDAISKSIIAQRFAENLESENADNLKTEASILYLLNAIEYAAGSN
ncbi:ATP-dependent nuclease [Adhaeribacter soli]|uniref:AAA family ATPase n=1 Tax=Adhaeribacter soli TaxID=2607655 RepID=A0A5N1J152_9BACT|nr:AAA family ATPase [Adhaeribacter soli]KAA9340138.1 AAA family ATPase [Adhaeribacter soli]